MESPAVGVRVEAAGVVEIRVVDWDREVNVFVKIAKSPFHTGWVSPVTI